MKNSTEKIGNIEPEYYENTVVRGRHKRKNALTLEEMAKIEQEILRTKEEELRNKQLSGLRKKSAPDCEQDDISTGGSYPEQLDSRKDSGNNFEQLYLNPKDRNTDVKPFLGSTHHFLEDSE